MSDKEKFASVSWSIADIRSVGQFKDDEAARAWLIRREDRIRSSVISESWEILEAILKYDDIPLTADAEELPFVNLPSSVEDARLFKVSKIKWDFDDEPEPDEMESTVLVYAPAALTRDALRSFLGAQLTVWSGYSHKDFDFEPLTDTVPDPNASAAFVEGWITMNDETPGSTPYMLRSIEYRGDRKLPRSCIGPKPPTVAEFFGDRLGKGVPLSAFDHEPTYGTAPTEAK